MQTFNLVRTLWGMFLLVLTAAALAQPNPDTLWTRTYGGHSDDNAFSVQQTTDGGFVVVGSTYSFGAGNSDWYVVRTNSLGDTVWTRTYGGGNWDEAYSIEQTTDGGYVVAGWAPSFNMSFCVVKTNSLGDALWTRTYGSTGNDHAYSVHQTPDGGYIVAGCTQGGGDYDFYLVRTNGQGDTLWTRTYGGSNTEEARSVQRTTDGGYVVAGYTYSFGAGGRDFYLVKTDSQGDTLWTRTCGRSGEEEACSIQQTADGGYIVAGWTESFTGGANFYLVKANSQGDTLWTRTYGGSSNDAAYCVRETADGGYIVVGRTSSFGAGGYDFYVVKTNSQGDTLWTRCYGGNNDDRGWSVLQTADGAYVFAGSTASFGAGQGDFYLVKTGPELAAEPITVSLPVEYTLYPNWPNPFNPTTQIAYALPKTGKVSLKVFNLLGEQIATLADGRQTAGAHTILFDGSGLASGIYFYRLQAEGVIQMRKMVLLK